MRLAPSRTTWSFLALYLAICVIWSAHAESPAPIDQVAPVEDIRHEIDRVIAKLGELLATAESFEAAKETEVPQNFGTLACLAQALAEHPDRPAGYESAVLRNVAREYTLQSSYEQAQATLSGCVGVNEGTSTGIADTLHPWNELVNMHAMMEEINARNAIIARSLRRPRGDADSVSNASTLAILALAMEADTHEVEGEEQIALWKELSAEYRREMTALADALRNNEGAAAVREHFTAANAACDRCHAEIRDVE